MKLTLGAIVLSERVDYEPTMVHSFSCCWKMAKGNRPYRAEQKKQHAKHIWPVKITLTKMYNGNL